MLAFYHSISNSQQISLSITMSFHVSASNIRVDDGHILKASVQKIDGEYVEAELDLNTCIGNDDGK